MDTHSNGCPVGMQYGKNAHFSTTENHYSDQLISLYAKRNLTAP
ncbi:hypothetical protein PAHA111176_17540 [Parendozoicomonas haliclonae]|uniref:Uncharacterized protein n=1 Tax=Parendozoicomonas haliclonae TaxID=1960125 RepID=A0A1X7ANK7_9GAMM|nr:hypothetical protein EHSB41UT_03645 [Parendozoicomonas haliclonae]